MTPTLKYFFLFLLFLAFGGGYLHAEHPIYILLTHPRATGTAFEKVMRTHSDMTVLHAPYLDPYSIQKYGPNHIFTNSLPDSSLTFEDVTNKLFKMAKESPVFFKESGYVLVEYLKEHPEFYKNPQVKIAFLIRDPAKSILSFYRKMPTVNESIIGHRQLWELFVLLNGQEQKLPLIIDSDEFLKNPLASLNHLGNDWDLKFDENNLCWENGYAEDWRLKDWYVEVANSTELGSYKGDMERNEDGIPKYSEVADEKDRLRLQDLYKIQNVYYQQLLNHTFKSTD
jgi:hypothetical protein